MACVAGGVRKGNSQDLKGIVSLYQEVFPHFQMDEELWKWLFTECPYGPAIVSVIEDASSKIVAHYAINACPFEVSGRMVYGGLGSGLMVAPAYRNPSTVKLLFEHLVLQARSAGLAFVHGYPNERSWIVLQRLMGWKPQATIVEIDLRESRLHDAGDVSERLVLQDAYPRQLTKWTVSGGCVVAPIRDRGWMNWRFQMHPRRNYRPLVWLQSGKEMAYAVLKDFVPEREPPRRHVVDWWVAPSQGPGVLPRIVGDIIRLSTSQSFSGVTLWAASQGKLHETLLELGGKASGRTTHHGVFWLREDVCGEPMRWHLNMADSDVY